MGKMRRSIAMKSMKFAAALAATVAAAAALPAAAQAQDASSGPVVGAGNTLLSLSAEGRSTRKPDLAEFSAGVTSQGKTAGEALTSNSADMNKVIAALKKAGIADKDIQTSNINLKGRQSAMTQGIAVTEGRLLTRGPGTRIPEIMQQILQELRKKPNKENNNRPLVQLDQPGMQLLQAIATNTANTLQMEAIA
jgi:hypothetical protein